MIGAAVAAVLAAVLFTVALGHSSDKKKTGATTNGATATVVVASKLIHHDTLLSASTLSGSLKTKTVPSSSVKSGAITSLDEAQGKVLTADLYAGEQLTATDLGTDHGILSAHLSGDERAVTLPIDKVHGMAGDVNDGDHVDVYASFQTQDKSGGQSSPVIKLLAQNAAVLHSTQAASASGNTDTNASITLGVPSQVAEELAFTADNGKLWVAARPASGASSPPPSIVTIEALLKGGNPITVNTDGRIR